MVWRSCVPVEGQLYEVTISDDREVLLAARAAGGTVIGLWREEADTDFSGIDYLVDSLEAATGMYLERVVRRGHGLPWTIAETPRLVIRELMPEDIAQMPKQRDDVTEHGISVGRRQQEPLIPGEETFTLREQPLLHRDTLEAYIRHQYGFYEYGIWAVVEKKSGQLVGLAGVTDCEAHAGDVHMDVYMDAYTGTAGADEVAGIDEVAQADKVAGIDESTGILKPEGDLARPPLELGYHIFLPFRRRGYAKEACTAILRYAREELCRPVYAAVERENCASVSLLKKLGFTEKCIPAV